MFNLLVRLVLIKLCANPRRGTRKQSLFTHHFRALSRWIENKVSYRNISTYPVKSDFCARPYSTPREYKWNIQTTGLNTFYASILKISRTRSHCSFLFILFKFNFISLLPRNLMKKNELVQAKRRLNVTCAIISLCAKFHLKWKPVLLTKTSFICHRIHLPRVICIKTKHL